MPDCLLSLASLFERLAAKKPKVKRFKDGIVILGEFGTKEVDAIIWNELNGKKVDLVVADVPYGDIVPNDWDKGVKSDDYIRWTNDILKFLVKGGSAYVYGGIGRPHKPRVFFEYLTRVENETKATLKNVITWRKSRAFGKKDDYLFIREEIAWLLNDADKPRVFNIPLLDKLRGYDGFGEYKAKSKYLRRGNVWDDVRELFVGKTHVAEKPTKLAEIMISTHTRPQSYIIDPFAGSGSSGSAARNLDRRFILVEKDPQNFAIIVKRLQ